MKCIRIGSSKEHPFISVDFSRTDRPWTNKDHERKGRGFSPKFDDPDLVLAFWIIFHANSTSVRRYSFSELEVTNISEDFLAYFSMLPSGVFEKVIQELNEMIVILVDHRLVSNPANLEKLHNSETKIFTLIDDAQRQLPQNLQDFKIRRSFQQLVTDLGQRVKSELSSEKIRTVAPLRIERYKEELRRILLAF